MNAPYRTLAAGLCLLPPALAADTGPPLVETCAECHGRDGMGQGLTMVPIIAGIPQAHIEEAIYAYVDGARRCVREPRMCESVATLSEDQVTAVADYYSGKARQASEVEFDQDLAAEGARLHAEKCLACHVSPDDERFANALGYPLHGQRPDYLRYALEAYRSGDRTELLPAMSEKIDELAPSELEALVNYYVSYRPNQ